MRSIDASENAPSAELEAKVHQHHRGLTSVLLRRRGRSAFRSLQLEGKDGSSVGHREPPADKPADIAAAAWAALAEHAARVGSGAYEVELVFASADKGPPPKTIVVPLAVGEDSQDLGQGTDPAVIVDQAMRLAGFSIGSLRNLLAELPGIAAQTVANMSELRKLGESMLEAIRNAGASSDRVAVAKLEAESSRERMAFAREFVTPGMAAIRDALGGPSSRELRNAAAKAAVAPSSADAPKTAATAANDAVAKLQADIVDTGRKLAKSLTDSKLSQLAMILGPDLANRLAALRGEATTHADVLLIAADIVDAGPERAIGALQLLDNDQAEQLDQIQDLSAKLNAAGGGK